MATDAGTPTKKQKLDDGEGVSELDESKEFDAETQKALEDIDACQNEIDALNEKASEEILQAEQKFNKLRKPHFEKRNAVIERIPNFWVTAFVNHPQISAILDEDEEECLQFMTKVEVEEFEDIKSGYKICFHFKENPYFSNKVLSKEFHLGTSAEDEIDTPPGDPTSKSTEVSWSEGKDLVAKANEAQKASAGSKRQMAALSRTFFQWFTDNTDPSADDIAEVLKDDMWPNPLQYFLASDMDNEENGLDSDEEDLDESVEVAGDEDEEEDLDDIDEEEEGEEEDGEEGGE